MSSPVTRYDRPEPPQTPEPRLRVGRTGPRRKWFRWLLVTAGVFVVLAAIAAAIVIPNWPYSESQVVPAIRDGFKANVTIKTFRRFYFPHPGCAAEYVTLTRPEKTPNSPPLATLQKLVIAGRWSDLLFRPHHLAVVKLDGLYVRVPPRGEFEPFQSPGNAEDLSKISIGSVTTNGAVLDVGHDGHDQVLKFEIHNLRVESIAANQPMTYRVSMGIPEPPGEIESTGTFGPWHSGDIGKLALSGTVKMRDAKLDKYAGIGGTVRSEEEFSGTLEHIEIRGEASSPDFVLKKARHPVQLLSEFRLTANSTTGEVQLNEVTAKVGRTTARGHGSVAKNPESGRRETSVDLSIEQGRAEDLLWFFNEEAQPAMMGPANFSARVRVPEFGANFLKTLELKGRFEVKEGRFRKSTQQSVNELSARAQGNKIKDPAEAPDVTVEMLASDVIMNNGVAHFPNLEFDVPAAEARMHGTYNFPTHAVDLRGDLRTEASISQDATGIKSVLLKPLDPLFHKKHAGAQVPVLMTGPISKPHFGTDIVKK